MKLFTTREKKQDNAEYRAGFTDGVVAQILAGTSGTNVTADVTQTAAAEFGIGLISRAMSVGQLNPPIPGIGPTDLAQIGRSLLTCGEYVAAIDVTDSGIRLLRAVTWDIEGGSDPDSWVYTVDLPGPSRYTTKRIPATGVVHIKINENPATPWKGQSPLTIAGISSKVMANLELRLSQEANSRAGYILAIPEGMTESALAQLKADLGSIEGGISITETGTSGYGTGRANAPLVDWIARRFGMAIPEHNVSLRRDVIRDIFITLGIPASMVLADGAALREGYRQLLTTTIQPMADIVAAELSVKLERPIAISYMKLAAIDVTARARAFGSLRQGGLGEAEALALAGLEG